MRNLDQLDLDILAHLFRDAGMTNKDLAALVGVAPSTCLERVRKLQQDGVLKGAHCEVDYQALGGHIQAMVSLQLARHSRQIIDAFRDAILALPEVISLFHMGGKDDFLVHLCVFRYRAPAQLRLRSLHLPRRGGAPRNLAGVRAQVQPLPALLSPAITASGPTVWIDEKNRQLAVFFYSAIG